ncbi:uncharacterized protein CLUP02_16380 [Colletotrichum lupini]|uniref:Uncharacterized protein n=1 Tax=Colletotrichum lupini TaxID=145971 RepID=A0A9Q8WP57_9PEZI|nr:uncharacterized protein CLUP02_16380 [Colletotrichum lupini]UQC90848.1 hypothetical protein CLUP02_16380 [Colletotrichum lupini]
MTTISFAPAMRSNRGIGTNGAYSFVHTAQYGAVGRVKTIWTPTKCKIPLAALPRTGAATTNATHNPRPADPFRHSARFFLLLPSLPVPGPPGCLSVSRLAIVRILRTDTSLSQASPSNISQAGSNRLLSAAQCKAAAAARTATGANGLSVKPVRRVTRPRCRHVARTRGHDTNAGTEQQGTKGTVMTTRQERENGSYFSWRLHCFRAFAVCWQEFMGRGSKQTACDV